MRDLPHAPNGARIATLALVFALAAPGASDAAELVVKVSGMTERFGQIGCALFAGDKGFPMDNAAARVQWLASDVNGVTCRFPEVTEGTYAVSIAHDLNGNKQVDTNFVGIPTEAWGVSNNVRPTLRAPKFGEASFKVPGDAKEIVIDIRVAK